MSRLSAEDVILLDVTAERAGVGFCRLVQTQRLSSSVEIVLLAQERRLYLCGTIHIAQAIQIALERNETDILKDPG